MSVCSKHLFYYFDIVIWAQRNQISARTSATHTAIHSNVSKKKTTNLLLYFSDFFFFGSETELNDLLEVLRQRNEAEKSVEMCVCVFSSLVGLKPYSVCFVAHVGWLVEVQVLARVHYHTPIFNEFQFNHKDRELGSV